MPPVDGVNNSGFFEDQRVADVNDAVLEALDRDWRWPLPMPSDWLSQPAMQPIRDRARTLLREQIAHPLWQLKDPRLCQTLPLWLAELDGLGCTPNILFAVRDGREVVQSLHKRDRMPRELAESLWLNSLLDAEASTRNLPRLLVPYAKLLDGPESTLTTIAHWLGSTPTAQRLKEAAGFVSKDQQNNHAARLPSLISPVANQLNDWVINQSGLDLKETEDNKVDAREALAAAKGLDTTQSAELFAQITTRQMKTLELAQPLINAQAGQLLKWESDFEAAFEQLEAQKQATLSFEENAALSADAARQQYTALQETVALVNERDAELVDLRSKVEQLTQQVNAQAKDHLEFRNRATRVLGDQVLAPAEGSGRKQSSNDYKGVVDLQVENNAHTRVIRYIREQFGDATLRVLEVGCSEGYFGAALKDIGNEVWGLETNALAADVAQSRLDFVYRDSIEAFLLSDEFVEERFDVIVFGDVLEHLLDPVRVLQAISARLTERGVIISSVPNVAHERVRMMLLEGRWEYSATGIMDNTHLHFFTRDNLVQMFTRANLAINRLSTIELASNQVQIPVSPATEYAFIEHIEDRERNVFQFITLAQPAALADAEAHNLAFQLKWQRRILSLPPTADSSLYSIRLQNPLQRHAELFGGEIQVGAYGAPTDEQLAWADTILLQREANDEQLALVDHLHNLGKRVVFDIDDYLLEPPEYLSVYEHCMTMRPKLISMLEKVDAVSASTEPLREKLLAYNPNVFLTPNYAWNSHTPIKHMEADAEDADETCDRVRILVASSDSVRVDFLVPALQQIQARYDIDLVGIGPPGDYLRSEGLRVDTAPLMSHEEFKAFAASRNNTFALIPLDNNEFNECKSAVKYFDYALAGVPCICSGHEPYLSALEQNVTGALCPNETEHWLNTIEIFINSALLRSEMATAARQQVVRHHNLNLTAVAWQNLFRQTRFPNGDPVYADSEASQESRRTKVQLARGTARHLVQPASWQSAWKIYKKYGFAGLRKKWKMVF